MGKISSRGVTVGNKACFALPEPVSSVSNLAQEDWACLSPVQGNAVGSVSLGVTTEMSMNKADSKTWDPERWLNI